MDAPGAGETDLDVLLASMSPQLNGGSYVFVLSPEGPENPGGPESPGSPGGPGGPGSGVDGVEDAVAVVVEAEGRTLVLPRERAESMGLPYAFVAAWITLRVHSSLSAVGLTAAVSTALAERGISANIMAGYFHDHVFVPEERREEAMEVLHRLSEGASSGA